VPLLEVTDLRVTLNTSRGPADGLRDISFALERGQTLGLIGESGCGKSITALALMGLLPDGAWAAAHRNFNLGRHSGLRGRNEPRPT
jgi:peptide/nickel transport system ATP-binding protein